MLWPYNSTMLQVDALELTVTLEIDAPPQNGYVIGALCVAGELEGKEWIESIRVLVWVTKIYIVMHSIQVHDMQEIKLQNALFMAVLGRLQYLVQRPLFFKRSSIRRGMDWYNVRVYSENEALCHSSCETSQS